MVEPNGPERSDAERIPGGSGPLCTGCGRPVEGDAYYCPHCGAAVSNLTPYIPYVNIAFNYGPYRDALKDAKGTGLSGWKRVLIRVMLAAALIWLVLWVVLSVETVLPYASLSLLIFLPVVLAVWVRKRREKKDSGAE